MEALISSFIIGLCTFFVLMIINITLAYSIHWMNKNFDWDDMLTFLKTKLRPYLFIWFVFSGLSILLFWGFDTWGYQISVGSGVITAVVNFVSLAIIASLVKRIYEKLKVLKINIGEKMKK